MRWPNYDWIAFRQHPKTYVKHIYHMHLKSYLLLFYVCALPIAIHLRKQCVRLQVKPPMDLDGNTCVFKPRRPKRETANILEISWTHLNTKTSNLYAPSLPGQPGPSGHAAQTMAAMSQSDHHPSQAHRLSPCLTISRRPLPSLAVSDPSNSVIWTIAYF